MNVTEFNIDNIAMFVNYFLTPLCATFVIIAILYPWAQILGLTDKPCHRKQHKKPVPLIGGLSIYLAIVATLFYNSAPLPNQTAFIAAITLLVCVGLIDDYKGLGVKTRMLTQIAAGFIMAEYADIKIENLGNLFGFGDIHLGAYATAFTIFAVVGGINAFNMIDGMDGLAGCLTLISILSLATVSWLDHSEALFSYCLIFIACLLAFLSLNIRIFGRSSAKIFLGDTGSTMLGFSVCWLAIGASQGENSLITSTTVLWIMALPLFDSVCIMFRRLRKGSSPFDPDREHLHHIFSIAGFNNNLTLILMFGIALSLSILGIAASRYFGISDTILFWSFLLLFSGHYRLMNYAWKKIKISRFLNTNRVLGRRSENQGIEHDRRSGGYERRYIPSELELKKYYRLSDGFMANVIDRRRFRKNTLREKGIGNNAFADSQKKLITLLVKEEKLSQKKVI